MKDQIKTGHLVVPPPPRHHVSVMSCLEIKTRSWKKQWMILSVCVWVCTTKKESTLQAGVHSLSRSRTFKQGWTPLSFTHPPTRSRNYYCCCCTDSFSNSIHTHTHKQIFVHLWGPSLTYYILTIITKCLLNRAWRSNCFHPHKDRKVRTAHIHMHY